MEETSAKCGRPSKRRCSAFYDLIYKWSLIDHANSEQGIVAHGKKMFIAIMMVLLPGKTNGLVKIKMATDNG